MDSYIMANDVYSVRLSVEHHAKLQRLFAADDRLTGRLIFENAVDRAYKKYFGDEPIPQPPAIEEEDPFVAAGLIPSDDRIGRGEGQ